jgi:PKD repeat protein
MVAALSCAVIAPAAEATVLTNAHGKRIGVFLRRGVSPAAVPGLTLAPTASPSIGAPSDASLVYNGGPVLHSSAPYLVFWDPSNGIPASSKTVLEQYLSDASADSGTGTDVYSVLRQYTDTTGLADYSQTFSNAQAIVDAQPYPRTGNCATTDSTEFPTCITDAQIRTELTRLISANSLPTGGGAHAPIYFVITPQNVNVCTGGSSCASNSFCAYHTGFNQGATPVLYAIVPFIVWANGAPKGCQTNNPAYGYQSPNNDHADQIADNLSHELSETITDPFLNGWFNSGGSEVADICQAWGPAPDPDNNQSPDAYMPELGGSEAAGSLFDQLINGHPYYTQTNWSNGDQACRASASTASITPQFTDSAPGLTGAPVSFDPSLTTSTNGFSSVTWDFGDGSAPVFSTNPPAAVQHAFGQTGAYTVTLKLVDTAGDMATVSHVVHVVDHFSSPSAAFTATPSLVLTGAPVAFNASSSSDPNFAPIASYSWNFGDGTTGSGISPQHVYAARGSYTATLSVTDSVGLVGQVSHRVTVASRPNVSFSVSALAVARSKVAFDAGASSDPNGASISSYSWSFGDGSRGSGQRPAHTYAKKGSYLATLTVTDSLGVSSTVSRMVSVGAPIQITKVVIKGSKVLVTVNGPGQLTIGRAHHRLRKGQTVTYKPSLTNAQKRQLRRAHKLTLKIPIKFVPQVGKSQSRTAKIKFHS